MMKQRFRIWSTHTTNDFLPTLICHHHPRAALVPYHRQWFLRWICHHHLNKTNETKLTKTISTQHPNSNKKWFYFLFTNHLICIEFKLNFYLLDRCVDCLCDDRVDKWVSFYFVCCGCFCCFVLWFSFLLCRLWKV